MVEHWNPHLIKDIIILERVQCRSTKYILNDFSSNYKCRLSRLNLLPLMYMFNYYDILFFIKHLKHPSSHFDISQYVTFSHGSTRSASYNKLNIQQTTYSATPISVDYQEFETPYHPWISINPSLCLNH